jgi:hypothetical protein
LKSFLGRIDAVMLALPLFDLLPQKLFRTHEPSLGVSQGTSCILNGLICVGITSPFAVYHRVPKAKRKERTTTRERCTCNTPLQHQPSALAESER